MTIKAVSLDVGGVLVVPDHGFVAHALASADVVVDPGSFAEGHYRGMQAVDAAGSHPEFFGDYLSGFLAAVGVPSSRHEAARAALAPLMVTPIWCMRLPGSMAGLARLARSGLRLAVTSNSDGTVEAMLRRHEILQVGDGPGVSVEVTTDSGAVGVAKPHRAIFDATVTALGLEAHEVLHVGDSVHYDVEGACAAGLHAVLFDPYGVAVADRPTVASLDELLPLAASIDTGTLPR